jgi:rRNA maturation RNase YbeY
LCAQRVEIVDAFALISHDTARWLETNAERAMRTANTTGELRIALLRDSEMEQAHERHCNAPGTTDVITFDLSENDMLDVDVFICVDEARRQGESRKISVERELLLYIVHAMLHCTGYNDKTEQDSARMHEREDELLTAIGIGPVYYADGNRERA